MTAEGRTTRRVRASRGWIVVGTALLVLPPVLGAGGCDSPERAAWTPAVRDSAGVRVVENRPESVRDTCRILSEPALEIGVRRGATSEQLYRVMDATRLSDGRVAVVNQGSSEIRIYGPEGRFLHAFGREGEGPGEFRDVFQIWREAGDTLLVGDYRPWRFHRFTPDGTHAETVRPDPLYPNPPEVMGVLADGSYVLGRQCCRNPEPGFHEQELHLVRHARGGEAVDTLGVYPYGRRGYLDRETNFMGGPLFQARTRVAVGAERIALGVGEEREVRLLEAAGQVRSIIRWTGPDRRVSGREVEIYRKELLAEYEDRPELRERFARPLVSEDRPVSDRFPAHATILLSQDGELWVRKYPRPSWPDGRGIRWLVFGRDGAFICHALTPSSIENVWDLHEVGDDYALASVTDELGVEYVHVYDRTR